MPITIGSISIAHGSGDGRFFDGGAGTSRTSSTQRVAEARRPEDRDGEVVGPGPRRARPRRCCRRAGSACPSRPRGRGDRLRRRRWCRWPSPRRRPSGRAPSTIRACCWETSGSVSRSVQVAARPRVSLAAATWTRWPRSGPSRRGGRRGRRWCRPAGQPRGRRGTDVDQVTGAQPALGERSVGRPGLAALERDQQQVRAGRGRGAGRARGPGRRRSRRAGPGRRRRPTGGRVSGAGRTDRIQVCMAASSSVVVVRCPSRHLEGSASAGDLLLLLGLVVDQRRELLQRLRDLRQRGAVVRLPGLAGAVGVRADPLEALERLGQPARELLELRGPLRDLRAD